MEQHAKISCMSVRKLQTIFKEYHQCTITEYIQQRRMCQAENLLTNSDLTISQVALTVGYSKVGRFAELFGKSTGILPSEFRKTTQLRNR